MREFNCSISFCCKTLGKPRSWYYYRNRLPKKVFEVRIPSLEDEIRQIVKDRPASYGYRRVYAFLKKKEINCDPKTVYRYMVKNSWLSSIRNKGVKGRRVPEGIVSVTESNSRWSSDMTVIKAWNGEKGRLAIIIDCGDREILSRLWAKRITGDNLKEVVRNAVIKRFGQEKLPVGINIEFLSDNGPEYRNKEFREYLKDAGFIVCNTPVRSPESNGVSEAFFKSFKRDYVYQDICESFDDIAGKIPGWINDYNEEAPHSALSMMAPAKFYATRMSKINKTPVQN